MTSVSLDSQQEHCTLYMCKVTNLQAIGFSHRSECPEMLAQERAQISMQGSFSGFHLEEDITLPCAPALLFAATVASQATLLHQADTSSSNFSNTPLPDVDVLERLLICILQANEKFGISNVRLFLFGASPWKPQLRHSAMIFSMTNLLR